MSKPQLPVIYAVDFDGTCVSHEYPRVGFDIGAAPVLKRIVAEGGLIILWTMRSGKELQDAVSWFAAKEIPLFGINSNPSQGAWTTSPKCYANIYIDDAALGCPLLDGAPGDRKFVDWNAVSKMLWPEQKTKHAKDKKS